MKRASVALGPRRRDRPCRLPGHDPRQRRRRHGRRRHAQRRRDEQHAGPAPNTTRRSNTRRARPTCRPAATRTPSPTSSTWSTPTPRAANAWLYLGHVEVRRRRREGRGEGLREVGQARRHLGAGAPRSWRCSLVKLKQTDKANAELADPEVQGGDLRRHLLRRRRPEGGDRRGERPRWHRRRPRRANDAAQHLSLATPQAGDGAYVRAVSLINEHRWDDALASLDRAEAAIGPHPDILTYKGYVWRHKGDWAKAEYVLPPGAGDRPEPPRRDRVLRRAEGAGGRHGRRARRCWRGSTAPARSAAPRRRN